MFVDDNQINRQFFGQLKLADPNLLIRFVGTDALTININGSKNCHFSLSDSIGVSFSDTPNVRSVKRNCLLQVNDE